MRALRRVSPLVRRLLIALLATCLIPPVSARAGATSPKLSLASAAGQVAEGARSAALTGSFEFPNAVEVGYPLQFVVFQGTLFVRYPVAGSPVSGTSPELSDGQLTENELPAFLAEGGAAAVGVRIVSLNQTSTLLAIPVEFAAGAATAVMFTVLSNKTVISNAIDFTLP